MIASKIHLNFVVSVPLSLYFRGGTKVKLKFSKTIKVYSEDDFVKLNHKNQ